MLRLVTATRRSQADFMARSLLGQCLPRLGQFQALGLHLAHSNTRPLAEVYNEAIDAAGADDVLVFVHDDVLIDDWMLSQRLHDGLAAFDVLGVAGNRRVQPRQVAWYLQPAANGQTAAPWDHGHLSGAIHHGAGAGLEQLSLYGPSPSPVRLLDGVFLAASAARLKGSGVRFDPALGFHFYDLDFCLSAHRAGLRLGTWPIAITHESRGGSINTQAWRDARAVFLNKWFS